LTSESLKQSHKPSGRFASLDGIRTFSVCLVMLSHLDSPELRTLTQHLWRWNYGATGVRIFFVISGFLITSLLMAEKQQTGRISAKGFYWRRALRIMPAYYSLLLVVAVAIPLELVQAQIRDLLAPLFYVSNYWQVARELRHTWSLSVEEQFYLIWPCCLIMFGIRRSALGALAFLAIAPVLRILDQNPGWDNQAFAFETMADVIATGCLLATWRDALWRSSTYRRLLLARSFPALPLAICVLAMQLPNLIIWNACIVSVLNIVIAMTIDRYMRCATGPIGWALNSGPIVWLGSLSYSPYLWQQVFLENGRYHWPTLFSLVAIFCVATFSYYVIERPFLRLKNRLSPAAINR